MKTGLERAASAPKPATEFECAECGTTDAESYVVTFRGGDQDDRDARTEVCLPCHSFLAARAPLVVTSADGGMRTGVVERTVAELLEVIDSYLADGYTREELIIEGVTR